ncbi:2'-5' RNA ligase family protein [Rubrolithibacter danxiaensis]|uniref:2'-5' RNA ligase family protein n=1 Tax=Rubrolithibacter danxiaensis TaxID=3390805 RepID=UPI003BF88EA3
MKNLYLTAILPPEQLAIQIDEIRQECAEKFGLKAGLKPPVHITLFKPLHIDSSKEELLIKILRQTASNHEPFNINLENFDSFDIKTLFIRVEKNTHLSALQKEITYIYSKNKMEEEEIKSKNTFKPHVTIAYRDIPPHVFPLIWEDFKNRKFKRSFTVTHFSLLKHNGKKWDSFKEFPLCKPALLSLF